MDNATTIIEKCTGWCIPFYLQIAIVVIQILYIYFAFPDNVAGGKTRLILQASLIGSLVAILIYYLCTECHSWLAWIVFFLPLVYAIFTLISLIFLIKNINQALSNLSLKN